MLAKFKVNQKHLSQSDIGVVSPYSRQCQEVQYRLNRKGYDSITMGTAETFQGQQRDVIIVSTVRTGAKLGFVKNGQVRFTLLTEIPILYLNDFISLF